MLKPYLKKILIAFMILGYLILSVSPIYAAKYMTEKEATEVFKGKLNTEYPKLTALELEQIANTYKTEYMSSLMKFAATNKDFSVTELEKGIRKQYENTLNDAAEKAREEANKKPGKAPNYSSLSDKQAEIVNKKLIAVNNVRDFIINLMLGIGVLTTILALIMQAVRLAAVSGQPMLRAACIHNILMTCITAFVLGSLAFVVKFLFYIASN